VLVANYETGSIATFSIRQDGGLGAARTIVQHEGHGPDEQRQKGPHAHCIITDPGNRYVVAAELGVDGVLLYRFNERAGSISPVANRVATKPGAGPRHLAFHPTGKFLYVINELDSSLTTFNYNAAQGTLTQFETVSTLPRDFTGVSFCADVHVASSGRFVYGSNRGHNSIVVFAIDPRSGRFTLVEHVSTEGKWPRNFTIDPSGRFVLVANQHTDNVVVFRIDQQTGRLTLAGQAAEIPTPVCLQFL